MTSRFQARLHHRLETIHTTIEEAFLNAGTVLSTVALLVVIYLLIWFTEK